MKFGWFNFSGRRGRRDRSDRGDRESVGELERARRRREDEEDEYERPSRSIHLSVLLRFRRLFSSLVLVFKRAVYWLIYL